VKDILLMTSAKEAIDEAKCKGKTNFYALVSGGKDSITACHVAMKFVNLKGIIMIDTTIAIPETHNHVRKIAEQFKLPLIILKPKTTYAEWVKKYGFPHPSQHRFAFIVLKWKPIYEWLKTQNNDVCLISGIRKKESKRRMRTQTENTTQDKSCKKMFFVAPLFNWKTEDVWDYLKKNNLEVSPCYRALHLSGDCLCGAYAQTGEAELIKTFYPEIAKQIAELEKVCKNKFNKWGNHSSMQGSLNQSKMEDYMCADCEIKNNPLAVNKKEDGLPDTLPK
jgi:3'-phosphoadenosine 5'-phosphosulfate sulfotransferase (PAPS reductase)/FAD synthetase